MRKKQCAIKYGFNTLGPWPWVGYYVATGMVISAWYCRVYIIVYNSYQDCPIDFHMLHSELFHDHELVPQLFHGFLCIMRPFT